VLAGGLITVILLYYFGSQSTTVAVMNSRVVAKTTGNFILPLLLQTVLAVTFIVGAAAAALSLLISHRISGPLYRFKKVMESLEDGDFSTEFRIRSMDQFHELEQAFNAMIRSTKQELHKVKENLGLLKHKLESISDQDLPEPKRRALAEIKELADELNSIIRHFRT
jgi:methyl-accepting chemotaxis protein